MTETRFFHFAQRAPDSVALIDTRGRTWSRQQLHDASNRIARALLWQNLAPGAVIAILAPNCFEFVAVYLAATQIGLYVVPLNWHLAPAEIEYVLENSGARVLFAHERLAGVLRKLGGVSALKLNARVSFGSIGGFESLDAFTAGLSCAPIENPLLGRMLIYTSATTGRPKAITLPIQDAAQALDRTIRFHLSSGVTLDDEIHLCGSMLYHSGPLDFVATVLHMGHTVILVDRWDPELLLKLVAQHRVTTTFMVPSMFVRLLKLPITTRSKYDVSSLKLVVHSAAPCPVETKRRMIEWWGPVLRDGYGATEGVGTSVTSAEWLRYPGTVGRPIEGTKLKILDDEGHELPCGEAGLIYLTRYQGDRFAYKDDPEKTQAAYCGEFFTVGDVGYVNAEGYLFICDRKVDMIICGGMNIYSAEIEHVLVQHPKVADCAIFGVPDELMGEAIMAAVQPMPDVKPSAALTAEIVAFLREQLSAAKLPRYVEYHDALPRDPNGKLYKRRLREPHWEGRGAAL